MSLDGDQILFPAKRNDENILERTSGDECKYRYAKSSRTFEKGKFRAGKKKIKIVKLSGTEQLHFVGGRILHLPKLQVIGV